MLNLSRNITNKLIVYSFKNICKRLISSKETQSLKSIESFGSCKESSSADCKDIAPDKHSIALILIDVINHLDFQGNQGKINIYLK